MLTKVVGMTSPPQINVTPIPYGAVAKVIDGLKGAGAGPVGLQLDNLN
ncbi:MAG: hypothetical protein M3Y84_07155 [Acidobacteriota bacterium]|nr:hypothetical protein [Acidobacteriota bacterium]